MDENLEMWRDALRQAAIHGETEALRSAAEVALRHHAVGPIRAVLEAAIGSVYLGRLERTHINLWVPA